MATPEQAGEPLQDALRRSEERYRSLAQANAGDVWILSLDGDLRTDVPQWRRATRQRVDEVLGQGWFDGVHPEDRGVAARSWVAAAEAGADYAGQYRIRPVRGDWGPDDVRVLSVRGVPVRDAAGALVEYVGVTADVTEQVRQDAERALLAARADEAADRTRHLQRFTAQLSRSLRVADICTAVLQEAQRGGGVSGGGVSLLDDTGTQLVYQVLEGYDTALKATWGVISTRTLSPGPHVLRTGAALFLSSPEALLELFPTTDMERFAASSQERAWARLPLATTGRPFGVLALGWLDERSFTEEDRDFLGALAGVAAQALERALQYERQRATALVLQRSLLLDPLPDLPGLTVSGSYQAGTAGIEVGGDWYDAFAVPDGRLALVLGDVRGKGAAAASTMGQVRAALRAYAVLDATPGLVLERLDLLVHSLDDPEEVVTVALALLDPQTGVLQHASAGHLPGLLRAPDGGVAELSGGEGLPLGVEPGPRTTAQTVLEPGAVLVWFSDGLVERRGADLDDGMSALRAALAGALDEGLDAERLPERLVADLVAASPEDDATVLVVQRTDPVLARPEQRVVAELPDQLSSASAARRLARQALDEWELPQLEDAVLLSVSELVTNAVVHARTPATVVLALREGVLRVEVTDLAPDSRPLVRVADDEATNGRGLALVAAVSDRWGVDTPPDGVGKTVWLELEATRTAVVPGPELELDDLEGDLWT